MFAFKAQYHSVHALPGRRDAKSARSLQRSDRLDRRDNIDGLLVLLLVLLQVDGTLLDALRVEHLDDNVGVQECGRGRESTARRRRDGEGAASVSN